MSVVVPNFDRPAIARASTAEVLGAPNVKVTLLADNCATGGALSTVRISLEKGADGARPHRHEKSAEMFYILDGRVQVLSGEDNVTAEAGDVIVVPPRLAHAFAAQRNSKADILIVIAPGVERFEYFRQLTRIARGEEPPENLRDVQDLYDNYFLNSAVWEAARK
ncbi:MAG TPA: cupin domain-containing protein [Bryobacteraceae bacterium]|jgi:mannose-6-phosphate isomerase-like protein (cupin superfamily)|nr:cupin domain-containing protein [Bryobacteraceae bacterium]